MNRPKKRPLIQRQGSKEGENNVTITVVVRCRPMSEDEIKEGSTAVVELVPKRGVIYIENPRTESGKMQFTFDAVYDENSKQEAIYDETCRPVTDAVLSGFNGTIFAYGQTGTGKTYTMEGLRKSNEKRGVIPNTFEHLFNDIARSSNQQFLISASYIEIYQENMRDLLASKKEKLVIRETVNGVRLTGMTTCVCKGISDIEKYYKAGKKNRTTSATRMNDHSSRSHAIFMITVECSDSCGRIKVGRLNLVDLAGSERQSKSGTTGDRLKEAAKINLSLSALGNVISALSHGKSQHVPYRDSKLTRLLQDSLGGNSVTVMIANIGPASSNHEETLTTLRYANRAKNIKNVPQVNEDPKDAMLREFQAEITRLRSLLIQRQEEVARRQTLSTSQPIPQLPQPSTSSATKKKSKKKTLMGDKVISEPASMTESTESTEDKMMNEFLVSELEMLEQERQKVANDSQLISAEKQRLLAELEEKSKQLKQEQALRENLLTKINSLESQLLRGGKNIIDHTNEQERALELQRQEIAEQKRREVEMLQKLEEQEESTLDLKETFSSLQQENESKTKKLRKMFSKLESIQQEIRDVYDEASEDRREMEANQKNMLKELKLLYVIIDNFIPTEEKNKLLSRTRYNNEDDSWYIIPLEKMPVNLPRLKSTTADRRPTSDYARALAKTTDDPRYKAENVISLSIEMPLRTTQDYEIDEQAQAIRAVLQEALEHEETVLEINCNSVHLSRRKFLGMLRARARSANAPPLRGPTPPAIPPVYPVSRGLVPK
ncbi:kinesin-II 95 kDa subunit-like isoform X2 [Ischnura elegans]|uniref:kinesin-II 95 kDa subunit-like isoform X2 n=1 Tax=Ischnura elegans TaxID=197161 RepID=UPI001ED8AAD8|nr:kinesin-II 95 kDa subunit-like isoform X2 [Ischnura elegans]